MAEILLISGLLSVIIFLFYQWFSHHLKIRKILNVIPGPQSLPFIGKAREITNIPREDRLKWLTNLCMKFDKGMVLIWMGLEPNVIIRKPSQMEAILPSKTLITKGTTYDYIIPWLGKGLITSTGDIWFNHRKLITPAFHFGVLEEYAIAMREKVEVFTECIENELRINPNKPINIFHLSVKYTLDTICKTAMDIDMDTQRKVDSEYVKALQAFSRIPSERFLRPWLKSDFIFYRTQLGKEYEKAIKTLHTFTEKVIKQKQIERKEKIVPKEKENLDEFGKRKPKAFIDLLLDANENTEKPFSLKELREEVDTFMFAGHDTTSAAISWGLSELGNNPDIQEKVRDELKELFGDSKDTATTKQLGQLKYMDRVIKEILRLYPSAPTVARKLDHDLTIDGFLIPKGTILSISFFQMHRDPEVWKDPETFDPDRFLPENIHDRHPYSYLPFSAGPRNCIGQKFALLEIKTALTAILRKWRVSSVLKPSEIKMIHNIILRPHEERIDLYFTPIDSN